jgi:hypothetical protein
MKHQPFGSSVVVGDDLNYTSANGHAGALILVITVCCDWYWCDQGFVMP